MGTIRIVRGTASASTALASYDAALADAGVCDYNLVTVSSMIPADAHVESVGTAPDLGPAGNRLTVVESRATSAASNEGPISAAIGWSREIDGGPGIFYEAAGHTHAEDVGSRVLEGLASGRELREWEFGEDSIVTESERAAVGEFTTVVVLAVYGHSEPIL